MTIDKRNEFIKKFCETYKLEIQDYVKPEIKSEKVFAVKYDIRPFKLCVSSGSAHGSSFCFS